MRIAHRGQQPIIDQTTVVAPTAIISGNVQVGACTVVLAGAIITSEGHPCASASALSLWKRGDSWREEASVHARGSRASGATQHITDVTVHGRAFIATGHRSSTVPSLEEGVVVAINAVVHIGTRCLAGSGVPIGHIAFGAPATVYPPMKPQWSLPNLRPSGLPKWFSGWSRNAWRMPTRSRSSVNAMPGSWKRSG
jgi:carbonic anhydrase/acetyltransferase-like protein (isoleucine patch superfamily)